MKHSWSNANEPFTFAEESFDLVDLERSLAVDRIHNSLGLPDDVIALIATYIDIRDLGHVAQVCKTWRRVTLKEEVWRYFAHRMGLKLKPFDNCRAAVARAVADTLRPDFCYAPALAQCLEEKVGVARVRVGVFGPCVPSRTVGVGKTALVVRFIQNHMIEEYEPTLEDSYARSMTVDKRAVIMDVLDTAGHEEYAALRDQWMRDSQAFLLCSPFEAPGSIKVLAAMYEQILKVKDVEAVPVVLVRTKADLQLPFADKTMVMQWIERFGAGLVSTSSKTGVNVDEAFKMLTRIAVGMSQMVSPTRTD